MDVAITLGTAGLTYFGIPVQSRVARGALAYLIANVAFVAFGKNSMSRATRLMLWGRNPKVLRPYGANLENWKDLVQEKDVVILIHGSPGNAGLMYPIINAMQKDGHVVLAPKWDTNKGLTEGFAALKKLVKEVRSVRENAKIHVVGHSWGGIEGVFSQLKGLKATSVHAIAARIAVKGEYTGFTWIWEKLGGFKPELKEIKEIQQFAGKGISGKIWVYRSKTDGIVPFWAQNLEKYVKGEIKDVVVDNENHLSILWKVAKPIAKAIRTFNESP